MTVREATLADREHIRRLARESWPDAPFRDVPQNDAQIDAAITWGLTTPDAGLWLLCDGADLPIGVLGVLMTNHTFTSQRIAIQWWLWIRPESRNGSGLNLIKSAEKWAKERGAVALQLVAPSPRFRSLCERLEYAPVEMTYQKELV